MRGLMAERQLLISTLIRHAARYHGDVEIVSRLVDRSIHRYTYAEAERRSRRLAQGAAAARDRAGRPGRHAGLEQFPPFRAVLRRLRHRRGVPHDQPAPVRRADRLHRQPRAGPAAVRRNQLHPARRAAAPATSPPISASCCSNRPRRACRCSRPTTNWSLPRARTGSTGPSSTNGRASALCYTSGTTGRPKGVLYTHRSTLLHAYGVSLPDAHPGVEPRRDLPGRADVPRLRLERAVFRADERRQAGAARPPSRRRQPLRAVRGGGRHAEPRRADRLARLRGASGGDRRALFDLPPHPVGRRGGAAVDDHRVRAARHRGHARAGA